MTYPGGRKTGLGSKTIISVADVLGGPWDVFKRYVAQRHVCGAGDHGGETAMWAVLTVC